MNHALLTARVAVVDYETYYDSEYSVATMSYWHYCRHPKFRAYRVGIVTNDGLKWVGDPKDAPWEQIRGHVWVSHNRPFDWNVHTRLQELALVPSWRPSYWGNSANLCAWIRAPRSLAKAVKALLGVTHDKAIRDKDMKGRTWEEYGPELQKRVDVYALQDCEYALRIWLDHIAKWPLDEIRISDLVDDRGLRGLCADRAGMEQDIEVLEKACHAAKMRIPWCADPASEEKPLSRAACAKECARAKIPMPESLDMNDEGMQEWEDTYGDTHHFIGAMRDYRRLNTLLKKYRTIYHRIKDDGRFEFSVTYMGTHTGRTSGTDKVGGRAGANMLNMSRDPFYLREETLSVVHGKAELGEIDAYRKKNNGALPPGVAHAIYLRARIVAPPGMKFVIADAAQIEARITNWIANDRKTMDLIRQGVSVYDAHAIALMGVKPAFTPEGRPVSLKKTNPQKYALAKARELALGFQAGHIKFLQMAKLYIGSDDYEAIFNKEHTPEEAELYEHYLDATSQSKLLEEFRAADERSRRLRVESWKQVEQFRGAKEDTLVALWKRLGKDLTASVAAGGCHLVELPDGRTLTYFDVKRGDDQSIVARTEMDGPFKYFYGGKILENAVQAFARQVFVWFQLKLDDLGVPIVLDIYDEVVCEVPHDFDESVIAQVMSTTPPFAPGLPLGAETESSTYYKK